MGQGGGEEARGGGVRGVVVGAGRNRASVDVEGDGFLSAKMRLWIIASSIIDDAKVAKRVRDKISVTFILMVHRYLRSLFLGVFRCFPF